MACAEAEAVGQNLRQQEQGSEAAQVGGDPDQRQHEIRAVAEQRRHHERIRCAADAAYEQGNRGNAGDQGNPQPAGQE
ncbi:hypothetical protein D3C80_1327010 [compost metagenome]